MSENKNTILVPVNFSEEAENGAIYALQIAAGIDADIVLLNIYGNLTLTTSGMLEPYSYMAGINWNMRDIENETETSLKALKLMLDEQKEKRKISNIEIKYDLVQGFPAETILAYAKEFKPSVIIMGSPGKKPKGLTPFGRVTSKIIDNATVPVLTVPRGYNANKFNKPYKVLYITNLDNTDYNALERLAGFAAFFGSKIICIHTSEIETDEPEEQKMKDIKKYLVEQLHVTNLECGILESVDPLSALEKFIKERGIDVLAFSTQKRNLLMKFFDQGPAYKFLYQTDIPLLVYHAK